MLNWSYWIGFPLDGRLFLFGLRVLMQIEEKSILGIPSSFTSIAIFIWACGDQLTSFSVTIMSLMIPWSLTLAVVDVYFVLCKRPSRQPGIKSVIVIGDWVLSFLSLAAACSTASVTDVLITSRTLCMAKLCNRYQLSAAMSFLSWFLSLASSLFNLWLLPST